MKQTAVEWLMARFESGDMYNVEDSQFIKQQAIKMEKEQCMADYKHGQNNGYMYCDGNGNIITAEQYYNETYKTNKQ